MIIETNPNNNEFIKIFEHFFNQKLTLNDFQRYYIYLSDNEIKGFIVYSIIYDRCELDYIAVLEQYQNNFIASKLMNYMINNCKKNNCKNITLEVDISNNKAINLYKKYNFEVKAIRKNYYGNKDAYLMLLEIGD